MNKKRNNFAKSSLTKIFLNPLLKKRNSAGTFIPLDDFCMANERTVKSTGCRLPYWLSLNEYSKPTETIAWSSQITHLMKIRRKFESTVDIFPPCTIHPSLTASFGTFLLCCINLFLPLSKSGMLLVEFV